MCSLGVKRVMKLCSLFLPLPSADPADSSSVLLALGIHLGLGMLGYNIPPLWLKRPGMYTIANTDLFQTEAHTGH